MRFNSDRGIGSLPGSAGRWARDAAAKFPADASGLASSRSVREVLNSVYLGTDAPRGGFFPNGVNGQISYCRRAGGAARSEDRAAPSQYSARQLRWLGPDLGILRHQLVRTGSVSVHCTLQRSGRVLSDPSNENIMITCVLSRAALFLPFLAMTSLAAPKPDPQMQAVLDAHASLKPKPIETLTPQEARTQPSPADAVKALLKKQGKETAPEKVADVDNRSIEGPAGKIKVRIYRPAGDGPFPVIVYYHGGGWVIADLDTYDATPRALANAANAVVVSSHYRQAPEHKFPAAHEDAFATYRWVLANAAELKVDANRIAVAGESAGGNLAAAVSMMAREKNVRLPVHQLLVYPVADTTMDTASYQENADAKPLSKAGMEWFAKHAIPPAEKSNPYLALVRAPDLRGLPPATIITAQIDPLRSEGQAYAEKLKAAGVAVSYRNYDGVTHEFFGMGAVIDKAKDAVAFAAENLSSAFAQPTGR